MGKVLGIATRVKTKAAMDTCRYAKVSFESGVGEDSRGKIRNHRQITVMTKENWDAVCSELGVDLNWTMRRANLLIDGFDLENKIGHLLRIGDFELEITGELDPCNRMDAQFSGLTNALMTRWRGGVTCKLIKEGEVKLGDKVELISN